MILHSCARRIPTPGDWHPTAVDGCVRVSVTCQSVGARFYVHIGVWGGDDHGVERARQVPTEDEALALYAREVRFVSGLAVVEESVLRTLGFRGA